MFSQKCASTLRPTDSRNSKIQSFQNLGAKRVISQSTQFCPPSHQSWWSGGLCCSHTIILHLCLRSGQISTRPCNGPHKRKRQTSPRIKKAAISRRAAVQRDGGLLFMRHIASFGALAGSSFSAHASSVSLSCGAFRRTHSR